MNKKLLLTITACALTLALGGAGYALYAAGLKNGSANAAAGPLTSSAMPALASAAAPESSIASGEAATRRHIQDGIKAGDTDPVNGKTVLYYQDPMVPGKRFEAPAKSPFMDMMLVPVYAGSGGTDGSSVTISPRMQQNLGLRTAEVVQGSAKAQLTAVGSIAWNERDQSVIQARASGFIERLYVRATLDAVRAGQPFADLYVPEWVAAQQEFLALKQAAGNDTALLAAGRQRMLLSGMTQAQIERVEASGSLQPRVTITVPSNGVVAELAARVGMAVTPGLLLARIYDLKTVWALAEVPESQIALLRRGAKVEARSPGAPGVVFNGTVEAILPEVNPLTRTLKVRVQLANPKAALAPGMLVTVQVLDLQTTPALLVPTEAVIATGQRSVVMLAEAGGHYRPVNVETGTESNGQTEIRKGLAAGQRVVVSSQFLIDSEASLKGLEQRLNSAPTGTPSTPGPAPTPAIKHQGEGKVDAIDKDGVTLSHGPVASAGWGSMTMAFQPPAAGLPRNIAVGDRVQFEFVLPMDADPTLTRIAPAAPAPAPAPAQKSSAGPTR